MATKEAAASKPHPVLEAMLRAMWANPQAKAELQKRVKAKLGIDVNTIKQLLDLLAQYAPQIMALVSQIIAMFAK